MTYCEGVLLDGGLVLASDSRTSAGVGDPYFTSLSRDWSAGVRKVFRELPDLDWFGGPVPPPAAARGEPEEAPEADGMAVAPFESKPPRA